LGLEGDTSSAEMHIRSCLAHRLEQHPRQCPACGSKDVKWDDNRVMAGISRRCCQECACEWLPKCHILEVLVTVVLSCAMGAGGLVMLYHVAVGGLGSHDRWWFILI